MIGRVSWHASGCEQWSGMLYSYSSPSSVLGWTIPVTASGARPKTLDSRAASLNIATRKLARRAPTHQLTNDSGEALVVELVYMGEDDRAHNSSAGGNATNSESWFRGECNVKNLVRIWD